MGKSYDLTDTDNPVAYHGASKDYINSFDHLDAPATKRAYKTDFPAHSSGAKREKLNKGRYDYMPARIVNEAYARVAAFGAEKYTTWRDNKWEELLYVPNVTKLSITLQQTCASGVTSLEKQNNSEKQDENFVNQIKSMFAQYAESNDRQKSNQLVSVEVATIDDSERQTKHTPIVKVKIAKIGENVTMKKSREIANEDHLILSLENVTNVLNILHSCPLTESLNSVLRKKKEEDARSVEVRIISTSTTITKQDSTEVSFVHDATTDSDFLETTFRDLKRHLNISERELKQAQTGAWNWAKGLPTSQIANSLQNHLWAYMEGENTDPESNLSHLDHLLWNAVALLYNEYHRIEDDRFKNIPKHEEKSFTIAK